LAVLTPQLITRAGTVITYQAASGGGDQVPCYNALFLSYRNASGGPITVTVNVPPANSYLLAVPITSPTVTIAAGAEKSIGPIDRRTFADLALGDGGSFITLATRGTLAGISYTSATGLSVAAIRLQQPDDGT
jgi:hypothetical protein